MLIYQVSKLLILKLIKLKLLSRKTKLELLSRKTVINRLHLLGLLGVKIDKASWRGFKVQSFYKTEKTKIYLNPLSIMVIG